MSRKLNPITLAQAAADPSLSLYVMSMLQLEDSDDIKTGSYRSLLLVTANKALDAITIPDARVPFDVSACLPKKVLLDDFQFRAAHTRGNFVILDSNEVEKMVADEPAIGERMRAVARRAAAADSLGISTGKNQQSAVTITTGTSVASEVVPQVRASIRVRSQVNEWLHAVESGADLALLQKEACETLANMTLSEDDVRFMLDELPQELATLRNIAAASFNVSA